MTEQLGTSFPNTPVRYKLKSFFLPLSPTTSPLHFYYGIQISLPTKTSRIHYPQMLRRCVIMGKISKLPSPHNLILNLETRYTCSKSKPVSHSSRNLPTTCRYNLYQPQGSKFMPHFIFWLKYIFKKTGSNIFNYDHVVAKIRLRM